EYPKTFDPEAIPRDAGVSSRVASAGAGGAVRGWCRWRGARVARPQLRWIPGFIAPPAMDARIHTRFPRWIRVSIAPDDASKRDGSPDPSHRTARNRAPDAMDCRIHRTEARGIGWRGAIDSRIHRTEARGIGWRGAIDSRIHRTEARGIGWQGAIDSSRPTGSPRRVAAPTNQRGSRRYRAAMIRCSDTGIDAPSDCANRLTRSSSIIQRIALTSSRYLASRPSSSSTRLYSSATRCTMSMRSRSLPTSFGTFSILCAIAPRYRTRSGSRRAPTSEMNPG